MLTMKIGEAKKFFFDTELVQRAMDKATRQALSKGGAFVMRGARKSIKPAKRRQTRDEKGRFSFVRAEGSRPGEPPRSHTGLLRDRIFFAADLARGNQSVVIGPERISGGGEAPSALEYGGASTVTTGRRGKRRRRVVQIAARPFMQPALEREAPKLPDQFRNAVRRV